MKAGIALKLFLVILAASAVAAGAMALATRASFQSGFLGYLNQVDAQRIDALAGRLADEYRRAGDWNFLRDDYARLRALALPAQPIRASRCSTPTGARWSVTRMWPRKARCARCRSMAARSA